MSAVLLVPSTGASAVTVTGVVGAYSFSTAATTGQAGACTYAPGVLSKIAVTPPLAKMRAAWTSRYVNQYVEFLANLYGRRSDGTWVYLTRQYEYKSVVYSTWTRVPALPAFTPSNGLKAGYTNYRVVETLRWLRPTDSTVEGTASVTLGNYWDGHHWWSNCPRPPAPITSPKPAPTDSTVTLTWTKPASAYHAIVVRYLPGTTAPATPSQGTLVPWSATTPATATAAHLAAGATYSFSLWSLDGYGHYSPRVHLSATTRPLPGAVTSLAPEPGTTSVTLTWRNPSSPDFAGVRVCPAVGLVAPSSPSCVGAVNRAKPATSYVDTSVQPGVTYSYALWSYDTQPVYVPTSRVTITVIGGITGLAAVPTSSSVQLTWQPVTAAGVTDIKLCRAAGTAAPTSPTCSAVTTPIVPGATGYLDSSLAPGTTYSYSVWTHGSSYSARTSITVTTWSVPAVTTATLPTAQIGTAYDAPLAASGDGGFTWTVLSGPAWLGVASQDLTGAVPDQPGSYPVTLQVTDRHGQTATADLSLTVGYVAGDVNGDGAVTCLDGDIVGFNTAVPPTTATHHLGDLDGNGTVDATDLAIWQAAYTGADCSSTNRVYVQRGALDTTDTGCDTSTCYYIDWTRTGGWASNSDSHTVTIFESDLDGTNQSQVGTYSTQATLGTTDWVSVPVGQQKRVWVDIDGVTPDPADYLLLSGP